MNNPYEKICLFFVLILFTCSKGFSQDCSINYFSNSYIGSGFSEGGSEPQRLTILPDSSMLISEPFLLTRLTKTGDTLWSKLYLAGNRNSGGGYCNSVADYDGNIVSAISGSDILKIDTSGNMLYLKNIDLGLQNGYNVNNSEELRDLAILGNGDKIVLYMDPGGVYGAYLLRLNKDMTVIEWCKNIQFNNTYFSNIIVDGSKIVVAGSSGEIQYPYTSFSFIAALNVTDGSLINANYFNSPNSLNIGALYKGNGQYFLMGTLQNETYTAGTNYYLRFDANLNMLAARRIAGYSNYFGYAFTLAPQNDNSLYGMTGSGIGQTIFNIDKNDTVKWARSIILGGYPSDIKQNSEGLFFVGNWNYNGVGVGDGSQFFICKTDFNGNAGNCVNQSPATFSTNNYNFYPVSSVALNVTSKTSTLDSMTLTVNNYPLTYSGCSYKSICNSIIVSGDTAVCNDQPVYYKAKKNPGCSSLVNWRITPSVNYTIVNDSMISINFTSSGNYKIVSSINDACNTYGDSETIHVNLATSLNLPVDSMLCQGNTIKLSAGNQFKSYIWQDGSTDSVYNVSLPGKYYVTTTDFCGNTFSDTIIIAAAHFYFTAGNDTAVCNQNKIILKATGGFTNYQWSPQYNLSAINDSAVNVFPAVDTSYIVTAQKSQGCVVTDTVAVKALYSPPVFLGNDTSLCTGKSLQLDAGSGFNMYSWNTGAQTQVINVNQVGYYAVKATALNGCSSTDTLQLVNVYPYPSFTLGNDTALCMDQLLDLSYSLPNASYLWNDGSIANTRTISQPGTYSLTVDQNNCTSSDTIIVSYKPLPMVNLGNDTTLCQGDNKQLDATYPASTYLWQDGSTNPTYLVQKAGSYYAVTDLNGCKSRDTININYLQVPIFSLGKDTSICEGQSMILSPQLTTTATYLWQDGSSNVSLSVNDAGMYSLTTSNQCGSFSDSVTISSGVCDLYVPSAFTPNNDGLNDVFGIKYPFVTNQYDMMIFNRWGQKVFESRDMAKGWDGTFQGVDQLMDTYVWFIAYTTTANVKKVVKGTVVLIR